MSAHDPPVTLNPFDKIRTCPSKFPYLIKAAPFKIKCKVCSYAETTHAQAPAKKHISGMAYNSLRMPLLHMHKHKQVRDAIFLGKTKMVSETSCSSQFPFSKGTNSEESHQTQFQHFNRKLCPKAHISHSLFPPQFHYLHKMKTTDFIFYGSIGAAPRKFSFVKYVSISAQGCRKKKRFSTSFVRIFSLKKKGT